MTYELTEAQLQALPADSLRRLQSEYPPITNDAPNPANRYRWAIVEEGRRRGMW